MNNQVQPAERANGAKDCFLNKIKTQWYGSCQVKEITCFKVLVIQTFLFVSFAMEHFLALRTNISTPWQKQDLKQRNTCHKKQNWSKVQYFCYKRKGKKFNYHYSDMEITKGHIKAAAQIFHFQSRLLGERKVCKYFYFTLCVNIRCLGLTQKQKCPGASRLLASTSLWEPIV